jgi:hypothetical protein
MTHDLVAFDREALARAYDLSTLSPSALERLGIPAPRQQAAAPGGRESAEPEQPAIAGSATTVVIETTAAVKPLDFPDPPMVPETELPEELTPEDIGKGTVKGGQRHFRLDDIANALQKKRLASTAGSGRGGPPQDRRPDVVLPIPPEGGSSGGGKVTIRADVLEALQSAERSKEIKDRIAAARRIAGMIPGVEVVVDAGGSSFAGPSVSGMLSDSPQDWPADRPLGDLRGPFSYSELLPPDTNLEEALLKKIEESFFKHSALGIVDLTGLEGQVTPELLNRVLGRIREKYADLYRPPYRQKFSHTIVLYQGGVRVLSVPHWPQLFANVRELRRAFPGGAAERTGAAPRRAPAPLLARKADRPDSLIIPWSSNLRVLNAGLGPPARFQGTLGWPLREVEAAVAKKQAAGGAAAGGRSPWQPRKPPIVMGAPGGGKVTIDLQIHPETAWAQQVFQSRIDTAGNLAKLGLAVEVNDHGVFLGDPPEAVTVFRWREPYLDDGTPLPVSKEVQTVLSFLWKRGDPSQFLQWCLAREPSESSNQVFVVDGTTSAEFTPELWEQALHSAATGKEAKAGWEALAAKFGPRYVRVYYLYKNSNGELGLMEATIPAALAPRR